MKGLWQHLRRWPPGSVLLGLLSALLGAALGGSAWQEEIATLAQLRAQVAALQAQTRSAAVATSVAAGQTTRIRPIPQAGADLADSPSLWPWLVQRLQSHGLQLLSLRDGAPESNAEAGGRVVSLELLGRWSDWLEFERQLHRHIPWWNVIRWQFTPAAESADRIRLHWQGQLAWSPPADAENSAAFWPLWAAAPRPSGASPLFAPSQSPASAVTAQTPEDALSSDPSRWPVESLRLHGIWHQAGRAHALLGDGRHQEVLSPGQRVGPQGHRILRVEDNTVILSSDQASVPPIHLTWPGGGR